MTISPPGDIILEVARAASPDRVRLATERLAKAAGSARGAAVSFTSGMDTMRSRVASFATTSPGTFDPRFDGLATHRQQVAPTQQAKALRSLEAFLLQGMIDAMLPATGSGHFGKGAAGNVWRSFFAETLGQQLAAGDGLGIAPAVLARIAPASSVADRG